MGEARNDKSLAEPKSLASQVLLNLAYVSVWIGLSGTVILYNKWILAYYGFPYPIALTIWHMTFSSGLAFAIVRLGYVEACNMSAETYVKAVVPIGACFAGTLWLGNAAYLYLSVSFIQMLKVIREAVLYPTECCDLTGHFLLTVQSFEADVLSAPVHVISRPCVLSQNLCHI